MNKFEYHPGENVEEKNEKGNLTEIEKNVIVDEAKKLVGNFSEESDVIKANSKLESSMRQQISTNTELGKNDLHSYFFLERIEKEIEEKKLNDKVTERTRIYIKEEKSTYYILGMKKELERLRRAA